ncbi:hypothetical protein ASPFODRAFT_50814 [Aspergillus luchuensis CBS 106.47]|uniref:Uncharacterized protein n=1 Tax=Aspergillus luchuensis (strain CBS 106.47) TaxID=1137211 RepID=A0A1M3T860_ASPLC|nr:hypothetical protein ASPFODRAFT_50814 [Aspergillus luchuensis CBS 106.47]
MRYLELPPPILTGGLGTCFSSDCTRRELRTVYAVATFRISITFGPIYSRQQVAHGYKELPFPPSHIGEVRPHSNMMRNSTSVGYITVTFSSVICHAQILLYTFTNS